MRESININSTQISLIKQNIPVLAIEIHGQKWLLVTNSVPENLSFIKNYIQKNNISTLLWWDKNLESSWLNSLDIKTAIVSDGNLELNDSLTAVYILSQDGAIIWNPNSGFDTQLLRNGNQNSFW